MNYGMRSEFDRLAEQSLPSRIHRKLALERLFTFEDAGSILARQPLGIFFYNVRFLFLFGSLFYLCFLALVLFAYDLPRNLWIEWLLLAMIWFVDVLVTLILHNRYFVPSIVKRSNQPYSEDFPPAFQIYFAIDYALIWSLVVIAPFFGYNLWTHISLLFAILIVLCAYHGRNGTVVAIMAILFTVAVFLPTILERYFNLPSYSSQTPRVLRVIISNGPIIATLLVSIASILTISRLRIKEGSLAARRVALLGEFEHILSPTARPSKRPEAESDTIDQPSITFRGQLGDVFSALCGQHDSFWYRSACLWLIENNLQHGPLLLPVRAHNAECQTPPSGGFSPDSTILYPAIQVTDESLQALESRLHRTDPVILQARNVPVAYIPIEPRSHSGGVLAVYGSMTSGNTLHFLDVPFLTTVADIISTSLENSTHRHVNTPYSRMNELFGCRTLDEIFPRAAHILQESLVAQACMILFRRSAKDYKLSLPDGASRGLAASSVAALTDAYDITTGLTGKSIVQGKTSRVDDAAARRNEFDNAVLSEVTAGLGCPLRSWMAIPIGQGEDNYGVIKVFNRTFRCDWFTDDDQRLGEDLAIRLRVIISNVLNLEAAIRAADLARAHEVTAQSQAKEASASEQRATEAAKRREDDLARITHHLLGPVVAMKQYVTSWQLSALPARAIADLEHINAFLDDLFDHYFAITSCAAIMEGHPPALATNTVDCPAAMKRIWKRLLLTNPREDLEFKFVAEAGFPSLRMDERIFNTVIYSLIHNALKYADPGTHVTLECSYERRTGIAGIKVKSVGEIIQPHEQELIFGKFQQGYYVRTRGRRHHGVGLGLWTARELLRLIRGTITVELSSKRPELSVFVVSIPIKA